MNDAAEIIGRLHEAVGYIKMARLKIDGVKCLMRASEKFREYDYLRTEAIDIDFNLWAELHNLRELAHKCGAKA